MNQLQEELASEATPLSISIVGVNEHGHETAYNEPGAFCDGRDIPFLEEEASDGVWTAWGVTYRDVFVLDANNEIVAIYNLTQHGLGDPENYDALKTILIDAATP